MTQLHDVALVDLPVSLFLATMQHHDAVLRELTLIALAPDTPGRAASRLVTLARELYGAPGDAVQPFRQAVIEAHERGEDIVTLRTQVPLSTLRGMEDLMLLFDEADDFCKRGDLLAEPSAPGVAAFRRWLVGELIRQVRDGAPPTPFWA